MPLDRRALHLIMPRDGWVKAPCHRYREHHPAHGWFGKSGRFYWCWQGVCEALVSLIDGQLPEERDELVTAMDDQTP